MLGIPRIALFSAFPKAKTVAFTAATQHKGKYYEEIRNRIQMDYPDDPGLLSELHQVTILRSVIGL